MKPSLLPKKYAKNLKYSAISYGREGLVPLPSTAVSFKLYDWNKDGFDDIIGDNATFHGGSPFIKVDFSSGGKAPIFGNQEESQIILTHDRLGRYFDIMDIDNDGKVEILTFDSESKNIIAFKNVGNQKNPEWEIIELRDSEGNAWGHLRDVMKTPPFTVTDWDEDGRKDLIVGLNHPSRMKHSFGTDPDIMKPEAFRMYLVKNIGTKENTIFARPQLITDHGEPVKYSGWAYPLTYDVDKDGLPDLVSAEHRPGIKIFRNVGGDEGLPNVEPMGNLKNEKGDALEDIIHFHLEKGDITGDGKAEFVSTTQFSGTTYYYPLYGTADPFKWKAGESLKMKGNPNTPVYGPGISTVEPVDWDGDSDTDLVLGSEPGMPMLLQNTGSDKVPQYSNPKFLKFTDGSPVRTYSVKLGDGSSHGAWEWYDDRSAPTMADWDGDGILDLISSTQGRRIYWMKGNKKDGELRFEKPVKFIVNKGEVLHPHRCKLGVADWNKDGKQDLFALNTLSEIVIYLGNNDSTLDFTKAIYPRTTNNNPLVGDLNFVQPPLHLTFSGRTGIAVFDWDNDGHLDVITHKHRGTVLYYRNTGNASGIFEPARVLFDFDSHLAGPAIMDYNKDGYPDILLGGDRKRYVGEEKLFPKPIKAHLMWYDGSSLPFPSAKR